MCYSGDHEAVSPLIKLHRAKTVAYRDAWRKRGELMSIFPNIARKFDRLEVAFTEEGYSADEPLHDTAADLCLYTVKYLTWLAEYWPDQFDKASHGLVALMCSDQLGPQATEYILTRLGPQISQYGSQYCWERLAVEFQRLEAVLMTNSRDPTETHQLGPQGRVEIVWGIAQHSFDLLLTLAHEHPNDWKEWCTEIEGSLPQSLPNT